MRLQAYLDWKNLSHAAFGVLLAGPDARPVPRVTVRQWATGQRFPMDPAMHVRIAAVTDGHVTAEDIADHVSEVRRAA